LINIYNEKINGWSNHLNNLEPRKELDDWYWSMEDILQHNADNLVKFTDKEHSKLESAIRNGWSKI